MNRKEGKKFMVRVIDAAAAEASHFGAAISDGNRTSQIVALAAEMGVSKGQIYHWLKRTAPATLQVRYALRLSALAGIDISEFVK